MLDMNHKNIEYPTFTTSTGWIILHHKIPCEDPSHYDKQSSEYGGRPGMTIWDLMFTQDMFHATNMQLRLTLDIGWIPHASPKGNYELQLLALTEMSDGGEPFSVDWTNPVLNLSTNYTRPIIKIMRTILESGRIELADLQTFWSSNS